MNTVTVLFYFFSAVLLFSSFRVITAKNPVHAVLFLVLSFFQAAMIWMLLKAEFLSIALVLVYVGAVMVLFLFVVMMLDVKIESLRSDFWKKFPLAALIGALVSLEMIAILMGGFSPLDTTLNTLSDVSSSNTKELGIVMYSQYLYPLEVATAILLVAVVAAIGLTLRRRKDSKHVDPSDQVRVRASERLVVLKQDAVVKSSTDSSLVQVAAKKEVS
jgi:NADH-quinone oxidoreductase subunit J